MEKDYSDLEVLFHQIMANMKVKPFIFANFFAVTSYFGSMKLSWSRIKLSQIAWHLATSFWFKHLNILQIYYCTTSSWGCLLNKFLLTYVVFVITFICISRTGISFKICLLQASFFNSFVFCTLDLPLVDSCHVQYGEEENVGTRGKERVGRQKRKLVICL